MYFTRAFGEAWKQGIKVDWATYYAHEKLTKVSAPTYVFDTTELPARVNPFGEVGGLSALGNLTAQATSPSRYMINWKRSPVPSSTTATQRYLIFSEGGTLAEALIAQLKNAGLDVLVVKKGDQVVLNANEICINPTEGDHFFQLFEWLQDQEVYTRVVYNWDSTDGESFWSGLKTVYDLGMALVRYAPSTDKKLTFLNNFQQKVLGNETPYAAAAAIRALADSFKPTHSRLFINGVDVADKDHSTAMISSLIKELSSNQTNREVAYRNGRRWVSFYDEAAPESGDASLLKPDHVYLVIGDAGLLSQQITHHLVQETGARVVVLNDTPASGNDWARHDFYQVNFQDKADLTRALGQVKYEIGDFAGVFVTATEGLKMARLNGAAMDLGTFRGQIDPIIQTIDQLKEATDKYPLDFVWLSGTVQAALGVGEEVLQAIADSYLRAYVEGLDDGPTLWYYTYLSDEFRTGQSPNQDFVAALEMMQEAIGLLTYHTPAALLNQLHQPAYDSDAVVNAEGRSERPQMSATFVAPEGDLEEQVTDVWKSFFGYEEIGVQDDFFELGGDSLKAMSMLRHIQKDFDLIIDLQDFYSKATVRALCEEINLATKLMQLQEQKENRTTITI